MIEQTLVLIPRMVRIMFLLQQQGDREHDCKYTRNNRTKLSSDYSAIYAIFISGGSKQSGSVPSHYSLLHFAE
jgi:hypothetical protein